MADTQSLDVRPVQPKHRLETIMSAWNALKTEDILLLTVDHDPQCMYYTLCADFGQDAFSFEYLENGPEKWQVKVTRR